MKKFILPTLFMFCCITGLYGMESEGGLARNVEACERRASSRVFIVEESTKYIFSFFVRLRITCHGHGDIAKLHFNSWSTCDRVKSRMDEITEEHEGGLESLPALCDFLVKFFLEENSESETFNELLDLFCDWGIFRERCRFMWSKGISDFEEGKRLFEDPSENRLFYNRGPIILRQSSEVSSGACKITVAIKLADGRELEIAKYCFMSRSDPDRRVKCLSELSSVIDGIGKKLRDVPFYLISVDSLARVFHDFSRSNRPQCNESVYNCSFCYTNKGEVEERKLFFELQVTCKIYGYS